MRLSHESEEKIIWLKDREALAKMGYVREKVQSCSIRTGPVRAPQGDILIGYAVLKKTTAREGESGFRRRVFTLHPEDRFYDPKGVFQVSVPPEAVDPLSIEPGKPSRKLRKEQIES